MTMASDIGSYIRSLTRQLRLDPAEEREITLELEGHLEDKAAEFQARGSSREEALDLAIQEMGSGDAVAKGMYEVHSPGVWRDVLLATVPHFLLASLFALHLWSHYFLVAVILIGIALVSWKNWRAGTPSKWSYSWLGYTLAAPILSWLLALITLAYGGWTLVTTGGLPFNVALFFLLIGYVPFSMWIVCRVVSKVVRRDWLLASLTALPFPFLTSWVLFLNWQGGLWTGHGQRMQDTDTARAFIFLALAVTTAVFLKVGPRLVRIGLLTLSTVILVAITAASLPVSLDMVAVLLMIIASVAFLLSPAMLDSQRSKHQQESGLPPPGDDVMPHGFTNQT
ncbi:MAG: hypothetical protein BZY88_15450 [SAR202 cluster bacterium Io17-Chloro-G9]|nr:MAG: hypothetical protein BZY88_15450 [SAR202 cluster bacterium Io17-Chloro-G9]